MVGSGAPYPSPSAAAAAARHGDRVRILPGSYYDCAVWIADDLVIEGSGADTRITDRVCQGKAIFVVAGNNVTIRGLTLSRARSFDGHAAAIRSEGGNLTIERVLIEDNQDGILVPGLAGSTLRVVDSRFRANGTLQSEAASAALRVGPIERLVVTGSVFEDGRGFSAILSAARLNEIERSRFAPEHALAGPMIRIEGGLAMQGVHIAPGRGPRGRRAAILAVAGDAPAGLAIAATALDPEGVLLLNWSGRDVRLASNSLPPGAVEVTSDGWLEERLRRAAAEGWFMIVTAWRRVSAFGRNIARRLLAAAKLSHDHGHPVADNASFRAHGTVFQTDRGAALA